MSISTNLPYQKIAEEDASARALEAVSYSFLLTMLPHLPNLPLWVSTLALFSMGWRIAQSRGLLWPAPKWLLVPLVVAGGIGVFAQYWTIVGREPGLALLTVMTSFKFLETRTHRDVLILVFLCYFLLAMHFLFGQSMQIAAYMFIVLIVITTGLISINMRDDAVSFRPRIKFGARLVALSIPIMIVLFVLVPRIPGPLWGLTEEQRGGITGLSDTMSPGQISNLITSNEVAFRVSFDGPVPSAQQLYWRGPVLAAFNGSTWSQVKQQKLDDQILQVLDQPVEYTVTLEPHGKHWLFALDMPVKTINESFATTEFQLTSEKPVNDLKRYAMASGLRYQLGLHDPFDYLMQATELPDGRNPKTVALGQQWARELTSDAEIINAALSMFRRDEFVYTLRPPLLGSNPSDEFLFSTKRGFCEHYASSFTQLMRAAGIPARVVTGYQGGEVNELGGHLIVRQSDAHAWSEVWLENRGWVRVDPTAAVSPDRIENGLDQALNDELPTFRFSQRNPLISQLLFGWDNLQNQWNTWVLNYNQTRQSRFLRDLGIGIRGWGDMVIYLVVTLVALLGLYGLVGWYRERPKSAADYDRVLRPVLKKLERAGFPRRPAEDVMEFAQRLSKTWAKQDEDLTELLKAYNKLKYGSFHDRGAALNQLRTMAARWSFDRNLAHKPK